MAPSLRDTPLPLFAPPGDEDEAAPTALSGGRLPSYIADHRQRLRDRFLQAGGPALPDYELLELVLFRAIPRQDACSTRWRASIPRDRGQPFHAKVGSRSTG